MPADTAALLVCAGNATRMGGVHKILHPLGDSTVFMRILQTLSVCKSIAEIVIVCREQDLPEFEEALQHTSLRCPVQLVLGGQTRQQSVRHGFSALQTDCSYIAIQDGARPLLREKDLEQVIADAHTYRAATLGVPVKDTIKVVKDGIIVDTPPRDTLFQTQTPQVFSRPLYQRALEHSEQVGSDLTDDCQLVEALGVPVHMTIGSYSNLKLTTPEDFAIAEALLQELSKTEEAANE